MFAFLALAGDFGGTVGPAIVGTFSEMAGGNLKIGLLAATTFPILLVVGLLFLNRRIKYSTEHKAIVSTSEVCDKGSNYNV